MICYIWGAVGLAVGVVIAVIGMLFGVWMDERRDRQE